jgi:hypothetical protein
MFQREDQEVEFKKGFNFRTQKVFYHRSKLKGGGGDCTWENMVETLPGAGTEDPCDELERTSS